MGFAYDTWGGSWSTSWGTSWGGGPTPPPPPPPEGAVAVILVDVKKCRKKTEDGRRCLEDEEVEELIALGVL